MSPSDTKRAPGMCAVSYSALSPTCSRTRSGSARCAFNHAASTSNDCRGLANADAASKHVSTKSFFIEISFDDQDAALRLRRRRICSEVDWERGEWAEASLNSARRIRLPLLIEHLRPFPARLGDLFVDDLALGRGVELRHRPVAQPHR